MKVPGVDALREALGALNLDTRGHKAELKKRLRAAKRRDARNEQAGRAARAARLQAANKRPESQDFDSYLVLDFEATCQRYEECHGSYFGFPNEIIEFPVLLLQWHRRQDATSVKRAAYHGNGDGDEEDGTSLSEGAESESEIDTDSEGSWSPETEDTDEAEVGGPFQHGESAAWELKPIAEFRQFVRPTWRPKLSQFCTELTGITQAQIDRAKTFTAVLADFEHAFIEKYDLFSKHNKTIWVTDGPWDLRDFVAKQCYISAIERPLWLQGPYIDLRSAATAYLSRGLEPVQLSPTVTDEGTSVSTIDAVSTIISPTDIDTGDVQFASSSVAEVTEAPNGFIQVVSVSPTSSISMRTPTTRGLATANIPAVLKALGLQPFEGRQHSGIDDVRNIARILQELVRPERQWRVSANAFIEGKERKWSWMKKNGRIAWNHPPGV